MKIRALRDSPSFPEMQFTDGSPIANLNHFRLLRVVGRGAFGKVRIVERKDTGLSFALKYIRKDEGMLSPLSVVELGAHLLPCVGCG